MKVVLSKARTSFSRYPAPVSWRCSIMKVCPLLPQAEQPCRVISELKELARKTFLPIASQPGSSLVLSPFYHMVHRWIWRLFSEKFLHMNRHLRNYFPLTCKRYLSLQLGKNLICKNLLTFGEGGKYFLKWLPRDQRTSRRFSANEVCSSLWRSENVVLLKALVITRATTTGSSGPSSPVAGNDWVAVWYQR